MITIFSCPKHFEGHIGVIQLNAIKSWTLLRPKPEIILLGNEGGVKEVCKEFGLKHIPKIAKNKFGTPLYSDVFEKGQKKAKHKIVCYVNSDIILMNGLMKVVKYFLNQPPFFMLTGWRRDIEITKPLEFKEPEKLFKYLLCNSCPYNKLAIDYFVFPRGLFTNLPPFALGRPSFDNWLLYKTRKMNIPLIDVTPVANVFHQNHGFLHTPGNNTRTSEACKNLELAGGAMHLYSLGNATHILTPQGLKPNFFGNILAHFSRIYNVQMGRAGIYLKTNSPGVYTPLTRLKKNIKGAVSFIKRH